MRRIAAIIAACLVAAALTGCRCQVVIAFGGPAEGKLTAPKTYDDVLNGNDAAVSVEIPLLGN